MCDFEATCLLFNIKTKESREVVVHSKEEIVSIVSPAKDTSQISIDKYHKVFYDFDKVSGGVTGWVQIDKTFDGFTTWVSCSEKDFICGDEVMLILCDDTKPINMTDEAKDFIISHLIIE